ncbi:MAG: helix-turn-helix transcriptional regulator [Prolixibacteraceae bacterium]|nr:helix-turn-helix transcriptional regulator [Prolixibacteraceae bacterium]
MQNIRELLDRSQRGIHFTCKSRKLLGQQVIRVFQETGIRRITELIVLLDLMAGSKEFRYHTSIGYSKTINTYDFYRFNKIHEHILLNFSKSIRLEDVANIANMSPTAFCRYFKKHSGKSFLSFLNEIRIGNACKLMIEDSFPVSRASMESGYNNLSHFNSQFKRLMNLTPSEYVAAYKK